MKQGFISKGVPCLKQGFINKGVPCMKQVPVGFTHVLCLGFVVALG